MMQKTIGQNPKRIPRAELRNMQDGARIFTPVAEVAAEKSIKRQQLRAFTIIEDVH